MNVTPLVDVVLVLLIIFMVVTPLMTKHFRVQLPEKPKEEDVPAAELPREEPQVVVLRVVEDGSIRVNKDAVADAELAPRLVRVLAARDDRTVFFHADDRVPYGRALDVMDLARSGGAVTLAVMSEPLSD